MTSAQIKRLVDLFPRGLSLVLFGVALWSIDQQLHRFSLKEIAQGMTAIPAGHVLTALVLMALNYGVMTGYDTLAIHYIRQSVPYRKAALVAILSTVISNNVGFAVLANSLIRHRFYSQWGITTLQIAGISAFCNLSYGLGQATLSGLIFLIEPLAIPKVIQLPFHSIHLLGAACLSAVLAYILSSALSHQSIKLWRWRIPHLPLKVTLMQIGLSCLDWMLSAAIFYVLLPPSSLSYETCLGIYLVAQFAGVLSNVPGGLGVFETVMLLFLSPIFLPVKLVGSLLAFRCIYNFLPFVIAVGMFGLYELRRKSLNTRNS